MHLYIGEEYYMVSMLIFLELKLVYSYNLGYQYHISCLKNIHFSYEFVQNGTYGTVVYILASYFLACLRGFMLILREL